MNSERGGAEEEAATVAAEVVTPVALVAIAFDDGLGESGPSFFFDKDAVCDDGDDGVTLLPFIFVAAFVASFRCSSRVNVL